MHSLLTGEGIRPPQVLEEANHVDDQASRQFGLPMHQLARSWVRLVYGGRNIVEDAIRIAEIEPTDSVVDLGCGDGSFLRQVAVEHGVTAPMVGVELSNDTAAIAQVKIAQAKEGGLPNVCIMQANIQQALPLRRNSANVVSLINVIYHVGNPEKVADKMGAVVQPGERIAIVTKDPGDLAKAWEWVGLAPKYFEEKYPGKYPDMQAPVSFYENCDFNRTLEIFDSRYERQYPKDPSSQAYIEESITPLKIAGENAWTDYLYVLLSICEELSPKPEAAECREFIKDVLKPRFEAELAEKGHVEDEARQYVLIYRKPERKYFNLLRTLGFVNNHPRYSRAELLQVATREKVMAAAKDLGALIARTDRRQQPQE